MKKVTVETSNATGVVLVPDNCQHKQVFPPIICKAPHRSNPECDCRWCVFNKEFNQANRIHSINI